MSFENENDRTSHSKCYLPKEESKGRIQKFKETEDTKHIYRKELDKICFWCGMDNGDLIDLAKEQLQITF